MPISSNNHVKCAEVGDHSSWVPSLDVLAVRHHIGNLHTILYMFHQVLSLLSQAWGKAHILDVSSLKSFAWILGEDYRTRD